MVCCDAFHSSSSSSVLSSSSSSGTGCMSVCLRDIVGTEATRCGFVYIMTDIFAVRLTEEFFPALLTLRISFLSALRVSWSSSAGVPECNCKWPFLHAMWLEHHASFGKVLANSSGVVGVLCILLRKELEERLIRCVARGICINGSLQDGFVKDVHGDLRKWGSWWVGSASANRLPVTVLVFWV